jgi:serine/threonine protein kinase
LPVELIHAEYKLRSRHGDSPTLESYRRRFPRQFSQLQTLLNRQSPTPDTLPSKGTLVAGGNLTSSRKIAPGGEGYQLLECIGRGAYGEVWRATAPGGVEVAVKLIKWGTGDSLSQVELRALELMKRLRHHFLSQVQAYWLADEHLYIVMDLADRSLQQRFDECKRQGLPGIPAPELLGYMREAAEALDYLHAHHVLHRDVKPANILLSSGHARLADFGLARLFMQEGSDLRATRIGTPLYMGPEVWEHKVGPSSDQYSLASTYVELRLGRPLFQADSQLEVMTKHLTMRPELQPLPLEEQRVLHRALAKKGDERYASCVEFVTELQSAVLGDTSPRLTRVSRRRLVLAGGVLAVAIGLGLAGLKWSGYGFEVLSPAPTILPPNCQPAEGAKEILVAAEGAKYWNRIVHALPGETQLPSGKPVEFVLIPHHPEQKIASFYLQENKVWNELFAEFNNQHLKQNPEIEAGSEAWPNDWAERGADQMDGVDMPAAAYPQHPVMRVSHHQAEEFAKWLGGSLPSPQQWDAAAGLFQLKDKPVAGQGPFRGAWSDNPRPQIAVNRAGPGPAAVGSSPDDISPSGARDMSGNGAEWTSEYTAGDFSTVTLRGRDYHKDRPLLYSDLLDPEATEIEREDRYYTSDHITFRVALPLKRTDPPPNK